ncbi:hypothetical protein [Chitinimonas sp.]|uniref:hypothetical protein n=1 Tax=Chitinimonas sp. TaxID=1934313 RepID=UPI002F9359E5
MFSTIAPALRKLGAVLSVGLYIASLTQRVFVCPPGQLSWHGYEVLIYGWTSLMSLDPRWLANLPLWLVWLYLFTPAAKVRPRYSIAALVLTGISLPYIPNIAGCFAADFPQRTHGLASGAQLWLAAIAVAVVAALLAKPSAKASSAPMADSDPASAKPEA